MIDEDKRERTRQILVGGGILLTLVVLVCSMLTGWRYLPSPLGDLLGTIAGVLSTPFLMETGFLLLGFSLVIWLNLRRRHADGEEWVDLQDESEDQAPRGGGGGS